MKKILLIDDDPITNFINKRLIQTLGIDHEVVVAENGQEGIDILVTENNAGRRFPDVILLDINMPNVNGFQFLEELYRLEIMSDAPSRIAILSSSISQLDQSRARELGIKTYLVKPMSPDTLRILLA